jgi:hypothetical protein
VISFLSLPGLGSQLPLITLALLGLISVVMPAGLDTVVIHRLSLRMILTLAQHCNEEVSVAVIHGVVSLGDENKIKKKSKNAGRQA